MTAIRNESAATYAVDNQQIEIDDAIVARAIEILEARLQKPEAYITSPNAAKDLVVLKLAERKAEAFCVLWLDNRHGVLGFDELFHGTIDGASVHPREVVRGAIEKNAAAVILVHNHPSGQPEPSQADQRITQRLRDALALVDVRVLDHLIVGGTEVTSFAERGLI